MTRNNGTGAPAGRGEVSTFKGAIGGLFALGIATAGCFSTRIQSLEIGVHGETAENRGAVAGLAKGLAHIEAVLEKRLPSDS